MSGLIRPASFPWKKGGIGVGKGKRGEMEERKEEQEKGRKRREGKRNKRESGGKGKDVRKLEKRGRMKREG